MYKTSNLYLPFIEVISGKKKRKMRGGEERRSYNTRKGNIVGFLVGMIFKVFNWSPAQAPHRENAI